MWRAKEKKVFLTDYGSCLLMKKDCFVVKNKLEQKEEYPLFDNTIGEVILKPQNTVSVGALASLCYWEIPTVIISRRGKP